VYSQKQQVQCNREESSRVAVEVFVALAYEAKSAIFHSNWGRTMSALFSTTQTALFAAQGGTKRMPFFMSMPAMCMCMAATASILLRETGVFTSVSLLLVAFLVSTLLLVSLVVIISLTLSCLTGLVEMKSLVGLTVGLTTGMKRTVQGD
jgi:ATP/ADP translocase